MRENEPEVWRGAYKLLDVKDYLNNRLCGTFTTTADCGQLTWLLDNRPGRWNWSSTLVDAVGLDDRLLPEVVEAHEIVGTVNDRSADDLGIGAGVPVCAGAGDVVASALGTIPLGSQRVFLNVGTGSHLGAHRRSRYLDPLSGVGTLCSAQRDHYLLTAAQENAGGAVEWGIRLLGLTGSAEEKRRVFYELASRATGGSDPLRFCPWLSGERVPIQSATGRGALANLSLASTPEDVARAILDAIAMNIRWALASVEKVTGKNDTLRLSGGLANSGPWRQILADCLRRNIECVAAPQFSGVRGAAAMATAHLTASSLSTAALADPEIAHTVEPNLERADIYDTLFSHHKRFCRSVMRRGHTPSY